MTTDKQRIAKELAREVYDEAYDGWERVFDFEKAAEIILLASAEARQAAEKIAREVYSVYFLTLSADEQSKQIIDPLAAIIAESYADLVRAKDTAEDKQVSIARESLASHNRAVAAESLNRELQAIVKDSERCPAIYWRARVQTEIDFNKEILAALVQCKDVLRWLDIQGGLGYDKHKRIREAGERAESAINSATPLAAPEKEGTKPVVVDMFDDYEDA